MYPPGRVMSQEPEKGASTSHNMERPPAPPKFSSFAPPKPPTAPPTNTSGAVSSSKPESRDKRRLRDLQEDARSSSQRKQGESDRDHAGDRPRSSSSTHRQDRQYSGDYNHQREKSKHDVNSDRDRKEKSSTSRSRRQEELRLMDKIAARPSVAQVKDNRSRRPTQYTLEETGVSFYEDTFGSTGSLYLEVKYWPSDGGTYDTTPKFYPLTRSYLYTQFVKSWGLTTDGKSIDIISIRPSRSPFHSASEYARMLSARVCTP